MEGILEGKENEDRPVPPITLSLKVALQHSMAPGYLAEELCRPVSSIDGHRHLRSARRGQLDVPRVRLSTYAGRVFCHARPSALPVRLRNNTLSLSNFRHQLKHFYFSSY